jgi:hypothetical protein
LRTSALRTFAEAFVIRRDEKKSEPAPAPRGEPGDDDAGDKQ